MNDFKVNDKVVDSRPNVKLFGGRINTISGFKNICGQSIATFECGNDYPLKTLRHATQKEIKQGYRDD